MARGDNLKALPPHGRPAGSPNKTTVAAKTALSMAFEGIGGVPKLIEWANLHPADFYRIWSKLVPQEVTGEDGASIRIIVERTGEPSPTPEPPV